MTTSTFTFTSETTADDVRAAYAAADIKGKSAMRTAHKAALKASIVASIDPESDVTSEVVAHINALESAMVAKSAEKVAPDYAAHAASRVAYLLHAADRIMSGDVIVPTGVTAPSAESIMSALSDRGLFVDGSTDDYVTLSGRKSGQGVVADYVYAALSTGDGPMTIAQLRNAWTADLSGDDYPTEPPTAGAVGACLVRDNDKRFTATVIGDKKKRGAKLS
jgi:hypothetical protein